jgi:uncharacterized protein YprB with RNaseH-like and TPR domain
MNPLNEKIGFLDIEASNLAATFGIVISYCIKELDGKIIKRVLTPKEIKNFIYDRDLMKQFCDDVRRFDKIVVFYGTDYKFDIPFLRTRATLYRLNFPTDKELKAQDLWAILKRKFKLHSNRLEAACEFFGIPAKGHRLNPNIWFKCMGGDKKSLNYILTHNIEDVESTETLWKLIEKYVPVSKASI